jgi:hypothetical protein
MTREAFIELHRHELAGYVADAALFQRQGGELALWLRTKMRQIDQRLGEMFDQLRAADPAPKGKDGRAGRKDEG